MGKTLLRATGLLATLAAIAGFGMLPSAKALSTERVVDLAISVESKPETVANPGAGVIYRVTVTNDGLVPALDGAVVENTLPAGFTPGALEDGCSAAGQVVTCPVGPLATAGSAVIDIPAFVSTTVGDYVNTATVTANGLIEPLEHGDNNTATATTYVRTQSPTGGSHAFVCGGCSLSYSDPAVGNASITVPTHQHETPGDPSSPLVPVKGVFVQLERNDDFTGQPCGDSGDGLTCQTALGVYFDESEDEYQVSDPLNPTRVTYQPANQAPCHGLPKCLPMAYYDPNQAGMGGPEREARCDGGGWGENTGSGQAYVGGRYQVCIDYSFKVGNQVAHVHLMKSKDPIFSMLK